MVNEPSKRYPSHIIVYDGACRLCNAWVNFVLKHDAQDCRFYFCAAQSKLGALMMRRAGARNTGVPLADYDSVLLVQHWGTEHTVILQKSDAALAIVSELGRPLSWLTATRFLPTGLRDWLYDIVAKNRYRWFGQYAQCSLPSTQHAGRFIQS